MAGVESSSVSLTPPCPATAPVRLIAAPVEMVPVAPASLSISAGPLLVARFVTMASLEPLTIPPGLIVIDLTVCPVTLKRSVPVLLMM